MSEFSPGPSDYVNKPVAEVAPAEEVVPSNLLSGTSYPISPWHGEIVSMSD